MTPRQFHSHPLAGGRLIALYITFVFFSALIATVIQEAL